MKVQIDDSARQLGVDKVCALCVDGVHEVLPDLSAFDSHIDAAARQLVEAKPSDENVFARSFSEMFEQMGHSGTVPAGVKMVARLRESGSLKRINPIVDAYNLVSAQFAFGIGAHDADRFTDGRLVVRRSQEGDTIRPLFSDRVKKIQAGDLIYADGDRPVAWLGRRDVDSDDFKVADVTRRVVFVLLGRHDISADLLLQVADGIRSNLALCCPSLCVTTTLS